MSGIYIPGMEMPTSCKRCRFAGRGGIKNELVVCMFTGSNAEENKVERLDGCPLIPVPEHGDLIERDALLEKQFTDDNDDYVVYADDVDEMPTVIPADKEGEG